MAPAVHLLDLAVKPRVAPVKPHVAPAKLRTDRIRQQPLRGVLVIDQRRLQVWQGGRVARIGMTAPGSMPCAAAHPKRSARRCTSLGRTTIPWPHKPEASLVGKRP